MQASNITINGFSNLKDSNSSNLINIKESLIFEDPNI